MEKVNQIRVGARVAPRQPRGQWLAVEPREFMALSHKAGSFPSGDLQPRVESYISNSP